MTPHFSMNDAVYSAKAEQLKIDNLPGSVEVSNIRFMATVWEPYHFLMEEITSWYRCKVLNDAVKGSSNSDHMLGLAMDFEPAMPKLDTVRAISGLHIPKLKQVIVYENSRHVHVALYAPERSGKTDYLIKVKNGQYRRL